MDSTSSAKSEIEVNCNTNMKNDQNINKSYKFFVFVNPESGETKGRLLLDLNIEKMTFANINPSGAKAKVFLYNLTNSESRAIGVAKLRKLQEADVATDKVRIIIGGGDGSIMWLIQEMIEQNISFDKAPIGIIPFGSGNDLSRLFGWGATEPKVFLGDNFDNFKSLISEWIDAQITDFDIWEVLIETHEGGGIKKVYKRPGEQFEEKFFTTVDSSGKEVPLTSFKKFMSIAYTFGLDGEAAYAVDKRKTTSRGRNTFLYLLEAVKCLFRKQTQINEMAESIEIFRLEDKGEEESKATEPQYLIYPDASPKIAQAQDKESKDFLVMQGNAPIFLCSNVPSYMGGSFNPWLLSKDTIGVHKPDQAINIEFCDQKPDDGKIEILSFTGILTSNKFARLAQTKGPIVINFKKSEDEAQPTHVFMQIDGEFIDVVAPKKVRLSLCPRLPQGKIKIMINHNSRQNKNTK